MLNPDTIELMPIQNGLDASEFQEISETWQQQTPPRNRQYLTAGPMPDRAGHRLSRAGFLDVLNTFADCGDDAVININRDGCGGFTCILHVEPGKASWLN